MLGKTLLWVALAMVLHGELTENKICIEYLLSLNVVTLLAAYSVYEREFEGTTPLTSR